MSSLGEDGLCDAFGLRFVLDEDEAAFSGRKPDVDLISIKIPLFMRCTMINIFLIYRLFKGKANKILIKK
ncbi:hypothetical protein D7X65_08415 [bacterium D16-56]|nr:hypothetical protein D7X65_08415 [bacterium D16-56]